MIDPENEGSGTRAVRGRAHKLTPNKKKKKETSRGSIRKLQAGERFVTGNGWFTSHTGAYKADLKATSRAQFALISELKNGASVSEPAMNYYIGQHVCKHLFLNLSLSQCSQVPTGSTVFVAGDLNFHSNDYDWLVPAGPTGISVMLKGTGTINGSGGYKFQMLAGGDNTFRIKIWEEATGLDTYDNAYDDDGGQPIEGGSIQVRAGEILNIYEGAERFWTNSRYI